MEKKLHIYRALPSLFTITAFVFGFNSILLAINGQIKGAIIFILISSLFDLVDGRVARMLDASSKFGAELDSLSDLVCFGIATSLIVLFYTGSSSKILYISIIFFSICSLIRLARFNLDVQPQVYMKSFFMGVPTPSGFLLGVLPISIDFAWGFEINPLYYSIYLIFVGFLMISNLPTPSTKTLKISKSYLPLLMGIITLILITISLYPWEIMSIFGVLYLFSILPCMIVMNKNKNIYKKNKKYKDL